MKAVLTSLVCLVLAACAAADTTARRMPTRTAHALPPVGPDEDGGCGAERYAYTTVLALAVRLGSDSDVFEVALAELRQQLAECLSDPPARLVPADGRRAVGAPPNGAGQSRSIKP